MEYLHIRNLEKYHPGYKDRDLKFAKIFFQMVQGDPDCELIVDEIDWARLIKFIILELQARKPIPLDETYLLKKGFDLKKRPISLTLNMLQKFVVVGTDFEKLCNVEVDKEVDKEVEKEVEEDSNTPALSLNFVVQHWNIFASQYGLSKIISLSDTRKRKIRSRLKEKEFDFNRILEKITQSEFLLGKSKDWKVSFDFIIANQNNYLKILEGKYDTNGTNKTKSPRGSIDFRKYAEEREASKPADAELDASGTSDSVQRD